MGAWEKREREEGGGEERMSCSTAVATNCWLNVILG